MFNGARVMRKLKSDNLPLSLQAQRYLLDLIREGTYRPGEQLPSEADLAAQLGISRPTLREALLNLEQEGVVVRRHGVGTFVAPSYEHRLESGLERLQSVLELASSRGLNVECDALQVLEEPAGPELADALGLPLGTPLTGVHRVIVVDGRPVAYMFDAAPTSVLSPADVDETFGGSVLDLLRRKPGLQVKQALAEIVALDADPALARKLRIQSGRAVLLIQETLFDQEGRAIEFSRNYFVPEYFRFHVVRR